MIRVWMKIAGAACMGAFVLLPVLSCSEDIVCDDILQPCPPQLVSMEFLNECVDSAVAVQFRIKWSHPHRPFRYSYRWVEIPVHADSTSIDSLGLHEYCATVRMQTPEGFIDIGESVRLALEFSTLSHVFVRDAVFLDEDPFEGGMLVSAAAGTTACDVTPPCPRGAGLGMLVGFNTSMGLVLEVFNAADAMSGDALTLLDLEWATAADTLPVVNLIWGDQLLESLPWTSPLPGLPITLQPGQPPILVDIPDTQLMGAAVALVRAHSSAQNIQSRGVFQGDLRADPTAVPPAAPPPLRLLGNHPDPFSSTTTFAYDLRDPMRVELVIHDVRGRRVARFVRPRGESGRQAIVWRGRDGLGQELPSGVYFYRITAGGTSKVGKAVLLR
jgi:hypothetical protein